MEKLGKLAATPNALSNISVWNGHVPHRHLDEAFRQSLASMVHQNSKCHVAANFPHPTAQTKLRKNFWAPRKII